MSALYIDPGFYYERMKECFNSQNDFYRGIAEVQDIYNENNGMLKIVYEVKFNTFMLTNQLSVIIIFTDKS